MVTSKGKICLVIQQRVTHPCFRRRRGSIGRFLPKGYNNDEKSKLKRKQYVKELQRLHQPERCPRQRLCALRGHTPRAYGGTVALTLTFALSVRFVLLQECQC
jgi:hypothetical protein